MASKRVLVPNHLNMALQRKNFRCPRDGTSSPIHTASANGSAGVVISHAELPPRQRKRLQVGTTNLIRSPVEFVEDAPRHICATNIDLLKATLVNSSSDSHAAPHGVNEGRSSGDLQVVRTEQRRLRSMTPSSSASRLETMAMRNIRTSNGARTALEHLSSSAGTQHPDPLPLSPKDTPKTHNDSHAKQQALFTKNRRRLYEAFVEKYGSMRAVFKAFDSDGDGVISFQRFHNMVEASEVGLTPEETRLMYTHVDMNGDNAMEFTEFAQMFTASTLSKDAGGFSDDHNDATRDPGSSYALKYRSPLELSPRSRDKMKELRAKVTEQLAKQHGLDVSVHGGKNVQLLLFAFKQFDTDNDGVLTYEQAKRALGNEYLKLQMHAHELEEMVRMIDRNGDELISMKEFVQYFGVGKREIPTDLLDNGRKKALVALHQKMNASLTPREEFDPEYYEKRVFDSRESESEVFESTGCLPESLSKRIAAAAIFQMPPSQVSPKRMLSGSKSVPTLGSLRATERGSSTKEKGPEVNSITPVSQDRFQHRRMERTDWTRVGLGGDGVLEDSGLFINDHDRFRTTTAGAYSPMRRGLNAGDLHRDQLPTSTSEFDVREQIRQARFERTQLQLQLMDANRIKEARIKDWKMRANVRKAAGQQFDYLDRIHDQEQRVAMKDLQMQKRHGGVQYLRMWAGSPDSQFNGAGGGRGEGS